MFVVFVFVRAGSPQYDVLVSHICVCCVCVSQRAGSPQYDVLVSHICVCCVFIYQRAGSPQCGTIHFVGDSMMSW